MGLSILVFVVIVVCALITVSFYTLYERKILSASHIRLGPNIVGVWGILQPFSDAVKLFSNESIVPLKSNLLGFSVCPILVVSTSALAWVVIPWPCHFLSPGVFFLILLVITALSGMLHLGVGLSSNSSYGVMGALRCLAQSVSYEVSMAIIFISLVVALKTLDLNSTWETSNSVPRWGLMPFLLIMWLMSSLAETNRSPFDFAESESELVSGFNVEYGSAGFAMLFIGEYTSMIFMSMLTSFLFISGSYVWALLGALLFMHLFVWIRAVLPRTRYDKLMALCWLWVLPISLSGCVMAALIG